MQRKNLLPIILLMPLATAATAIADPIREEERAYQGKVFKQYWDVELDYRLGKLPTEGGVRKFRIPYSGHDYPDANGGTDIAVGTQGRSPIRKYDRAFNDNRLLATSFERQDVNAGQRVQHVYGLFGMSRQIVTSGNPGWYGHCNAWTAASIRHAEPQKSVVRNGVTFTPADIKALLAEVYMYSETEHLGGVDHAINPATLHVVVTNWIGRCEVPIGMETRPGEVVYNYPIFAYKARVHEHNAKTYEVSMNVLMAYNNRYEHDKSPPQRKQMTFHYLLDLDDDGKIVGGRYFGDSNRIDMFWWPLKPAQGGQEGNERGNPHIDAETVLAMWRDSVPEETRELWLNIDPLEADAELSPEAQPTKLWGGWKPRRKKAEPAADDGDVATSDE